VNSNSLSIISKVFFSHWKDFLLSISFPQHVILCYLHAFNYYTGVHIKSTVTYLDKAKIYQECEGNNYIKPINRFNSATLLCLSQARTWISNRICRCPFYMFNELRYIIAIKWDKSTHFPGRNDPGRTGNWGETTRYRL
jgi:hypothetical protein